MGDMTKICKQCGEVKPPSAYWKSRFSADNLWETCKVCCYKNKEGGRESWAERTFRKLRKYGTKDLY